MIEIPQMCNKCRQALLKLAAKNGGLVFCSHRSQTPRSGVFVAAVPARQGGCKLQIIHPCTESEARNKADQIRRERMRTPPR